MKLAILHYHFNRGGVTQVVANQLRSLSAVEHNPIRHVTLFYGGRRAGWPKQVETELSGIELNFVTVPALDYENEASGADLTSEITTAFQAAQLRPDNCLLHIHNHSLGKNSQLPKLITDLGNQSYRQLLQIHDFAEDFRPENFKLIRTAWPHESTGDTSWLYPQAPHLHYATLNGRDHRLLSDAGVAPARLHFLPNPVPHFPSLPSRTAARKKLADRFGVASDRRMVLYPVRAIGRKNMGELLLWSAIAADSTYGITLNPLNTTEIPMFRRWQQVIEDLNLPVITGLGEAGGLSFLENLAAADAIITTSVAEGFGMVFLESWLAGCPLIGRDLPEITSDFRKSGIQFNGLAPRIDIPIEWIPNLEDLRSVYRNAANSALQAFGLPELTVAEATNAFDRMLENQCIDFACLDISRQIEIIKRIRERPDAGQELREKNSVLSRAADFDRETCRETIISNAAQATAYSLEKSGQRLLKIYQQILEAPIQMTEPLSHAGRILDGFIDPSRLQLIRLPS